MTENIKGYQSKKNKGKQGRRKEVHLICEKGG